MEEECNNVDSMTISDYSLTLVNERKDIEVIDSTRVELTVNEDKDKYKKDCRHHDELQFYFNNVAPLLQGS